MDEHQQELPVPQIVVLFHIDIITVAGTGRSCRISMLPRTVARCRVSLTHYISSSFHQQQRYHRFIGFHHIPPSRSFQTTIKTCSIMDDKFGTFYNKEAVGRTIKGVVFDMDGTLTVPCIDFQEMRRRVGVEEGDILHVIHGWPEDKQEEAFRKIAEIEEEALEKLQVMPGAVELCATLDEKKTPRALVTRNVSSSVKFFHDTAFPLPPFHPSISREWKPYKPDPASLHHIADCWCVGPDELVMIGDSAKDDVVCGNAAGAVTILLDEKGLYHSREDPSLLNARPDFIVKSLHEASTVLHNYLQLSAP